MALAGGRPQEQLDLFTHVASVFADAPGPLGNEHLYRLVAARAGLSDADRDAAQPIGRSGTPRSVFKRQVRWMQQNLKLRGLIRHVADERGVWEWADPASSKLLTPLPGAALVAFSTRLGIAVWSDCRTLFQDLNQPIHLVVTSPPFPLARQRLYGNPSETEYVAFLLEALAPLVRHLVPGGSICLDLGQDIFEPGLPSRSIYLERLVVALHDRLGLHLIDRLVWHNPSKPPGPTRWASIARNQLNVAWQPIICLTNDPAKLRADNRRVLEPHTEKHRQLIERGGEQRTGSYGDGAYTMAPGRFAHATPGKIPRNVITRGHRCSDTDAYRRDAKALGLPVHGAVMPLSVPDFLIRFLSEPGDLVADPFGGTAKTGMAAERLQRRWIVAERALDYLRAAAVRFSGCEGFEMPDAVERFRGNRS